MLIIIAESMNGILRELVIKPLFGDRAGGNISFLIAVAFILGFATLFSRWVGATSSLRLLAFGTVWALLTFGFEMLVGSVTNVPAEKIWADYDPSQGGLMLFGLAIVILAPLIGFHLSRYLRLSTT